MIKIEDDFIEEDLLNIKLRGSGQIVNLSRLSDDLVEVIFKVIEGIDDPLTKLSLWAYMVVGLSIDEIRDRLIITEGPKAKFVSREYIRQKIKNAYEDVYKNYTEMNGTGSVSTTFYNKFLHSDQIVSSSTAVFRKEARIKIHDVTEDQIAEENTTEEDTNEEIQEEGEWTEELTEDILS